MSSLTEAIAWLGPESVLCLFVVGDAAIVSQAPVVTGVSAPGEVKSYYLENSDRSLGDRVIYEYDLVFSALPKDLEIIVGAWLHAVIDAGAEVAWFAFEGSFHFDHLLTRDIAGHVYGIADGSGLATALDDGHRESSGWAQQVEDCRNRSILELSGG